MRQSLIKVWNYYISRQILVIVSGYVFLILPGHPGFQHRESTLPFVFVFIAGVTDHLGGRRSDGCGRCIYLGGYLAIGQLFSR